ncbi:rhodanese [Rhodonellum psychrophilum GCM71 = DSM 17998]|uniref:Rhodanese n=2 Tax=Rhodonellum TaxID=336827 RepID=U5C2V7_9BACT|nr:MULTISPECIES: rhodanese-like domain-containing protein [Rhodonellum]ERM84149.1 rhodanese [Rhodonellum psychrophilum GCM71 = DSM 17998]MDO9554177.1 rhodanese-like domain-containing protein [Rhodonellum sp.]SDZ20141.1 Rhodanese-related sulfurtransferase [Rhodonellum ikkaensis]
MFDFFRSKPKNYIDLKSEDFNKGLTAKDAVLIDVRSAGEFNSGKIKGARNIDIMGPGFLAQIQNLPKDKSYYLYCRSGNRSGQAADVMGKNGFEKVYNLAGGVMDWPFELV